MRRLMSTAAVIATVASTGAAVAPTAAEAVSISGAKRQMRKNIIRQWGDVSYGSLVFFGCEYRGSRNRVECGFSYEDDDGSGDYTCGASRISYNVRGYRWVWRTFGVSDPCDY